MKKASESRNRHPISPARADEKLSARNRAHALLADLLTIDDLNRAKKTMLDCLTATKVARVGGTKSDPIFAEVPDHQIRGWMGKTIYEFVVGKARERHEHLVVDKTTDPDNRPMTHEELLASVRNNPDLTRRILEGYIESAKPVSSASDECRPRCLNRSSG